MNHTSSRSHCIFRVVIKSKVEGSNVTLQSTINLIDLAGSEGVAKSDINGKRLKEGSAINKSLLSMYTVINKLNRKEKYIGFRESKLTRILQPYLGGTSYTAIICNIHPLKDNYQESINTLRFAMCAGGVKNSVKINYKSDEASQELNSMKEELHADLEENKKLESDLYILKDRKMSQISGLEDIENLVQKSQKNIQILCTQIESKTVQLEELKSSIGQGTENHNLLLKEVKEIEVEILENSDKEKLQQLTSKKVQLDFQLKEVISNNTRLLSERRELELKAQEMKKVVESHLKELDHLKSKGRFFEETNSVLSRNLTPTRNGGTPFKLCDGSSNNRLQRESKNLSKFIHFSNYQRAFLTRKKNSLILLSQLRTREKKILIRFVILTG